MVGADGIHSIVRQSSGIGFPGYDLEEKWSIADLDLNGGYDNERFSAWLRSDGVATIIVPIESKRVRVVSSTPDALGSLPFSLDIKTVRRTGTFTISVRQAENYRCGKVFLAGDSAHCHSPVGGKGMNLGIADAVALANAIDEGTTEHYTEIRHPIGRRVIKATERARKSIQSRNPITRATTRLMFRVTDQFPRIQKLALRRLTRV